jgi:3D (Asp-Asp-Asp) domain-containing protein
LGFSTQQGTASAAEFPTKIETETAFDQKEILEYETIHYPTEYVDNPETEYGEEEILIEGKNGIKTLTYLFTHWENEEIDKQLLNTEIAPPTTEEISRGTKIVWTKYVVPGFGEITYWYKMRVWATKYDANCEGCWGRTYTGKEVKKGICAVDPKIIPLGTEFYVDRYGPCVAEDIGGAIKGNKVDLGYVNSAEGAWGAEYTDIYLLTNAPE